MQILVSGGAGFIGSYLCEKLLKERNRVICVDNLITGSESNIEEFKKNKKFNFLKKDVGEPFSLNGFGKINQIYHLASPADPSHYLKYPIETLLANSLGTYNLLKLSLQYRAKFLYASSSEVYGDPKEHPQKESYFGNVNPVGIRSCYDEGKRFGEALVTAYYKKYKLDVRIIRIFNTYGPKMHLEEGRMVPNFIMRALKNKPLPIYGDGKNTRSLCYIYDLVEGLVLAMNKKGTAGEVFNLGNPDEYGVEQFAKIVIESLGSNSKIEFENEWEDDPKRRKPDISKATRLLGWQPKVPLKSGLQKTMEYFRKIV